MKFLMTFFLAASLLFSEEVIGTVTAVEGTVTAIDSAKKERQLEMDSTISLEERIETAADGKVQIRFTDGGLLNLNPNSEWVVSTYRYRKLMKADQFRADLMKGGLRYLSGSIAKKNPNEYELRTPDAIIGLRGTIVTARIVEGALYVAAEEGKVILSNSIGTLMIGEGEPTQFAFVASRFTSPQASFEQPKQLHPDFFVPPPHSLPLQKKSPILGSHPPKSALPERHRGPKTGGGSVQIHGGC